MVLLALAVLACRSESEERRTPTWRVVEQLRIGSYHDSQDAFSEIGHVIPASNGRLYITQPMQREVRIFDQNGAAVGQFGRRGDGPGEVGWLLRAGLSAEDTVWIGDLRRIHFWDLEGEYLDTRSISLPRVPAPFQAGGSVQLLAEGYIATSATVSLTALPKRAPRPWFVLDPGDALVAQVEGGPLPGVVWPNEGSRPFPELFSVVTSVAFAPDGSTIVVANQRAPTSPDDSEFQLVRYSHRGEVLDSTTVPYRPIRIQTPIPEELLTREVRRVREPLSVVRSLAQEGALEGFFYPIETLRVGSDGSVWAKRQGPDELGWWVFDAELTMKGRIVLPGDFTVMAADSLYVWGVERDSLDVPFVVKYRLERNDP